MVSNVKCHFIIFSAYLNQPVDEDSTHFLIDVKLVGHVIRTDTTCDLQSCVGCVWSQQSTLLICLNAEQSRPKD